jgi:hypothetical protein
MVSRRGRTVSSLTGVWRLFGRFGRTLQRGFRGDFQGKLPFAKGKAFDELLGSRGLCGDLRHFLKVDASI